MAFSRREFSEALFGAAAWARDGVERAKGLKPERYWEPGPAPEIVVKVREELVESTRGGLERFFQWASLADLYFMREVLMDLDGMSHGIQGTRPELELPQAFLRQIGEGEIPNFIAVPDEIEAEVRALVDALSARGAQ